MRKLTAKEEEQVQAVRDSAVALRYEMALLEKKGIRITAEILEYLNE